MTIELEGMEFHAYHGCLESERLNGNLFVVDFTAEVPFGVRAAHSDKLEDSANYAEIYDAIAEEMQIPSDMLEHVAGRIIKAIAHKFPQIGDMKVRVSKSLPPVNGVCKWSRISLSRKELGI